MGTTLHRRVAIGVSSLVLATAACTGGPGGTAAPTVVPFSRAPLTTPTELWPAPLNAMELTAAAGLQAEPKEHGENHSHAHLDVFLDGKPIGVPSGIGIDIASPDVVKFADPDGTVGYGGITVCGKPCISPLHTHAWSGILHTKSPVATPNTLGEFFIEWDVVLSATCVGEYCSPDKPIAIYINGEPYTGDPAAIELTDRKEIAIAIGTPPEVIPSTSDFSRD